MKKQLLMSTLAAAVMAGAAVPASAEDIGAGFDVSANVGLVSDYLWRGVSQSNNQAAIQGGIDVKHSSGAYAGTWWSSLSGWYSTPTGYASTEQDIYVGYGLALTSDIALDLRYTDFTYANGNGGNFDELHAALSGYGATVGADYADNREDGNSSTVHYYGSYGYTLPMDIGLSATYGVYDLKDVVYDDVSDYSYWNIGVSKKLAGITFGLSYNDSDISDNECAVGAGGITNGSKARDACGEQFVFTATKSL